MTVAEFKGLWVLGVKRDEIARLMGCSPDTVKRRANALGLPPRTNQKGIRRTSSIDPRLGPIYRFLYWDREMSLREIAVLSGCSHHAVRNRMNQLGIPRRDYVEGATAMHRTRPRAS